MVKVKCPRCATKYQFVQCHNCGRKDGLLREVIHLADSDGEQGAFCRACGMGRVGLDCKCGCAIAGDRFSKGAFIVAAAQHDLLGAVCSERDPTQQAVGTGHVMVRSSLRLVFKTVAWTAVVTLVAFLGLLLGLAFGYKGKYR